MWFTNVNGQDIEATEQREIATNIDRALESGLHAYVKEGYKLDITGRNTVISIIGGILTASSVVLSFAAKYNWPTLYLIAINPDAGIILSISSAIIALLSSLPLTIWLYNPNFTITTYIFGNSSQNYQPSTWTPTWYQFGYGTP